jgi:putative CocE/NonD family hydrolase
MCAMSLGSEILARRLGLPAPLTRDVRVERDLRVPMDDGAVLLADRYSPRGPRPQATVLVRSPYGRRSFFGLLHGRLLAERGFTAVVQSVRGTFGSDGELNPFDERADGLATIRWIRAQPWHSGRLGMTGASYLGLTQWAVARDGGLDALAPSATASQFHGQAIGNGAVSLETAMSWVTIVAFQEGRLGPARMMRGLRRLPQVVDALPIGEMDTLATGRRVPFFADWMTHTAADDPYWAARDFSAGVGEVVAPVQLVGGWQDIFLPWMLEDFTALQAAGRAPQLVVGPWSHTSPGLLRAATREGLAWLRAHLLGDRSLLSNAPVRLWVGGAREWRELESWPPPGVRAQRLHLHAGGRLAAAEPEASEPDRYRYDPAHPTPSLGGPGLLAQRPVVDNRPLEARDDVLVYSGEPLPAPLEAIGPVRASIHVRSNLEHFDIFVRVCDVDPSGHSRNVCDALARVDPGTFGRAADGSTHVVFDLWPTAHRFRAGHRIRVQVSSGAHPRYARNPGTGEPLGKATRQLVADQEVLHDPEHPSMVELTVT